MPDLRQQLHQCLEGRVCFIGLGNETWGDDALGIQMAERLAAWLERAESYSRGSGRKQPPVSIVNAGTKPERWLRFLEEQEFDQVVFLDAVEFGGQPGSVILLEAQEIVARFPPVSTHKLSLGLLAQLIQASGRTRVWLLGVQPATLQPDHGLTPPVHETLDMLVGLMGEVREETASLLTPPAKPTLLLGWEIESLPPDHPSGSRVPRLTQIKEVEP